MNTTMWIEILWKAADQFLLGPNSENEKVTLNEMEILYFATSLYKTDFETWEC